MNEVNVKRKRKFWTDFWMKCNSRAAVVRGKVVSASGLGLFGVRVSSANAREGFTLTRDDGIFDLMVNGGAAVVIHFGRTPFKPRLRTVNVPWNEVITFLFFYLFFGPISMLFLSNPLLIFLQFCCIVLPIFLWLFYKIPSHFLYFYHTIYQFTLSPNQLMENIDMLKYPCWIELIPIDPTNPTNCQVVILDTLTMSKEEDRPILPAPTVCRAHDYDMMRPVVLATWKHGFQGSCPTQSPILAESQVHLSWTECKRFSTEPPKNVHKNHLGGFIFFFSQLCNVHVFLITSRHLSLKLKIPLNLSNKFIREN